MPPLTAGQRQEFDDFARRAAAVGLMENPFRKGSWGAIVNGKFREVARIDVGEAGRPGWRGRTHVHIDDGPDHLDPATTIPGERSEVTMAVLRVVPPTLDLLHDCAVRSVRLAYRGDGERTLAVEVDCPRDLGHPDWDGRRLRLTADGVLLVRGDFWGHTAGGDSLDAWREALSPATEAELERLAGCGIHVPPRRYTVAFHSGSAFEVVCGDVAVEILAPPGQRGAGDGP